MKVKIMLQSLTISGPLLRERLHKRKSFTIEFKPGLNLLIGPNGCGKTTILNWIKEYRESSLGLIGIEFEGLHGKVIKYKPEDFNDSMWNFYHLNRRSVMSHFQSSGEGRVSYHQYWVDNLDTKLSKRELDTFGLYELPFDDDVVVISDEPETSGDLFSQQQLAKWFLDWCKKNPTLQVIIATHSPMFISVANENPNNSNIVWLNSSYRNDLKKLLTDIHTKI